MALGALGALGVVIFWLASYLMFRTLGLPGYVAYAIPGSIPFLLITFGRPRRPLVSLMLCIVLLGVNSYLYVFTLLSDSSTRGLNALGAILYSWVIWGAGMAVDNWRRERTPPLVSPPRPDRN